MKRTLLFAMIPLLLAAAPALAESMPQGAFDFCQGGDLSIHVSGWAYDPDASSQSIDVYVNIYTDSDCNSLYSFHRLTANVSRPDVNQAKGITGNHGFNADISVPAGTYWVAIMAIDATANYPYEISQQVGPTRSVTVVPSLPGSGTAADPYRISSVANWNAFAARVNAGVGSSARYRLDADIGSVTNTVGTQGHPFRGTFNGSGHTLTVSLSGTGTYLAPFSSIGGGTISNLVVAGTVAGGMHCSGLVGIIVDGASVIENCKVAVAISTSRSHFGGFIGHSVVNAVTLRGCVFSGSLSGGTYVATFHGWSDDGATTTLIDCLDASGSDKPIGRGTDAACVSNTYYFASKDFSNGERLWSATRRGKPANALTEGAGVTIDFGTPAATYGTAGIAAYQTGMVYNDTFYAGQGDIVRLDLAATPPFGMMVDTYVASAGFLSQSGGDWTLEMPGRPVVVNANWTAVPHDKVQLWARGPFWGETNVGAEEPWESGYYFWWGDTVGYKWENGAWVASDGSSSAFSFNYGNTPTQGKDYATLQSEGWITADGVLAPAHDAAQAHWGSSWRVPTNLELGDLVSNCDWSWTTTNGVSGYVVRGRGDYSAASIFLPAAGSGVGDSLSEAGSFAGYWSSVPDEGYSDFARFLSLAPARISSGEFYRFGGVSLRPVQVPAGTIAISFNANGGSVSTSSLFYTPGETYGSLPAATREGYTFEGWFTVAGGGTQVTTASTVPASATTLYAHWTVIQCTVTLDGQGGTGGTESVTATYDSAMPAIAVPTRIGYVFSGYYTDTNGGGTQYYSASGQSMRNWDMTGATTLYAHWAGIQYTVTLDGQGGTVGTASVTATYGSNMPVIGVPRREGHVFGGYYTGANGGGTQYYTASGASARNWDLMNGTTLYAKWTPSDACGKVKLWANGPFWAETNVGADEPWESGLLFWWGDTIGYRRENNAWVASDGSTSNFSFGSANPSTYDKDNATLQSEGWITADGVLAPEHDAAQVHWGGGWRMPTYQELYGLYNNCDWTLTTNGVKGYVVRGRGDFADASIFLPVTGYGTGTNLYVGLSGFYWPSVPHENDSRRVRVLRFLSTNLGMSDITRQNGASVRPVWQPKPIDISALTSNFTAEDGDVLTGTTVYKVAVPAGALVTINGVAVTGVGGATVPAPAFSSGGEAITTKFERGAGDTWAITAFAELDNDAMGADVADDAITVYRGDTVDGITNAVTPTITGKKSAVKVEMTVDAPTDAPQQFFRVGFGD